MIQFDLDRVRRLFWRAGGRLVRLKDLLIAGVKNVLIAGVKAAIDAVLNRDRASISLERVGQGRYYGFLLVALTRIGTVGCSVPDAYRAWTSLPARDFLRNVRINWRSPSQGVILSEGSYAPNILQIKPLYYSLAPAGHRLFAPYFAHPEFYRSGLHDLVRGMRGQQRNIRIFFAGTLLSSKYTEKFRFPILSRDKVLGHVIANFKSAIETRVGESGSRPIYIVLTSNTRDIIDKHKLSLRDYMGAMSRSDFFICPAGWLMPHSHNIIEAMSVGTIPITNYHSYMRPTLTPDANCLAFSTVEELQTVINRALCMPAVEIQSLRDGVISYYDEHLEPESFGKKLMELSASISELVVNDETGR
jgi:hypothetical protein